MVAKSSVHIIMPLKQLFKSCFQFSAFLVFYIVNQLSCFLAVNFNFMIFVVHYLLFICFPASIFFICHCYFLSFFLIVFTWFFHFLLWYSVAGRKQKINMLKQFNLFFLIWGKHWYFKLSWLVFTIYIRYVKRR